jgi:hypothetical protein
VSRPLLLNHNGDRYEIRYAGDGEFEIHLDGQHFDTIDATEVLRGLALEALETDV